MLTMSSFRFTTFIFLILSLAKYSLAATQTHAYVYYEDAECISGSYILGTAIYAYDNERMSGNGFVRTNYRGPCKYFEGGYFDFMYDGVDGSYMKNGYCIKCNGIIGCTDTRYSCSGFSTVIPSQSYTLSQNGTDADEEEDDDDEDNVEKVTNAEYTYAYNDPEEMVKVEMAEQKIYTEFSQEDYNAASGYISILGVFLGMCSMIAIKLGSRAIGRLQRKKAALDANTLVGEKAEIDYNGGEMI